MTIRAYFPDHQSAPISNMQPARNGTGAFSPIRHYGMLMSAVCEYEHIK